MDALIQLEREFLPVAAVEILHKIGSTEYKENDFSVKKFSFKYANGVVYYVVVLHFPFREEHRWSDMSDRAFIVFSPDRLEKVHFFLSVYKEYVKSSGETGHFFEARDCVLSGEEMIFNLAEERIGKDDFETANQACIWALASEKEV